MEALSSLSNRYHVVKSKISTKSRENWRDVEEEQNNPKNVQKKFEKYIDKARVIEYNMGKSMWYRYQKLEVLYHV